MEQMLAEEVTTFLHANGWQPQLPARHAWRITSAVRVGYNRYRTTASDRRHTSIMSVCTFDARVAKIDCFWVVPVVERPALHLAEVRFFEIKHVDGVPYINSDEMPGPFVPLRNWDRCSPLVL